MNQNNIIRGTQGEKGHQGVPGPVGTPMEKWGKYLSGEGLKKWQIMMDFIEGKKTFKELKKLCQKSGKNQ